jgi:glycerophosphoryl diester phosphodiesterase
MADHFLILGHRGSPKRFPENTIASFEEALRAGADGFETDLRLLSDRTAVLYHDDELDEAEVESLSAAQILERGTVVEKLEALEHFAGRGMMVLEVKRSRWEETLLEHVNHWPDFVVASFDHSVIDTLRRSGATCALGITVHGYIVDVAAYAERLGANWVFPDYRFVDELMVTSLHDRGIRVMPWTANRRQEWERLRELGCDGLITDYPEEAVVWRDELKIQN